MARLRQLPQLYLRGAIANETMRHLSEQERTEVNTLTDKLVKSSLLAQHRNEFVAKLGQTIGGDYHDDRQSALQEFYIAIWRAVVYLRYHSDYSFVCEHCKETGYETQRNRRQAFNRRYPICPNCQCVKIIKPNQKPTFSTFETVQRKLAAGNNINYISPLISVRGIKKVEAWETVLGDPQQTTKFFGEFSRNYIRQHLRENEITHHTPWQQKSGTQIVGSADRVAVDECLSVLVRSKYPHSFQEAANPNNGRYQIIVDLAIADVGLIEQLYLLHVKYNNVGVIIRLTDSEIIVDERVDAPIVEATVIKKQAVSVMTSGRINDQQDEASALDVHHDNIIGNRPMQEEGIAEVESADLLAVIHESLPDEAKQVMEIITQSGPSWEQYCITTQKTTPKNSRGTAPIDYKNLRAPRESQLAEYFNVSHNTIRNWISVIRMQCLANGLVTGNGV